MTKPFSRLLNKPYNISPRELTILLRKAKKKDQTSIATLVDAYLAWAIHLALECVGDTLPRPELESAAQEGLLEAIAIYKPRSGVKFNTFVGCRVRIQVFRERRRHGKPGNNGIVFGGSSEDPTVEAEDFSRSDLLEQRKKVFLRVLDEWCKTQPPSLNDLSYKERKKARRIAFRQQQSTDCGRTIVLAKLGGKSFSEIAREIGLGGCRCQQIFNEFQRFLENRIPEELRG